MANVSVYNTDGQEVGKIDLNDAVFGVEVNEHLVHMAVVAQLANKRQGTKALETEGNRPRKTGFHQSSAVEGRRRCLRTDSERLHDHPEPEGKETGSEERPDQPRPGEQVHRCR